jgi:hypothetical protein
MQQKFDLAHQTLEKAESVLESHCKLAKIKLLLEKGRVCHQSGDTDKVLPLFIESYEHSKLNTDFDFHTVSLSLN